MAIMEEEEREEEGEKEDRDSMAIMGTFKLAPGVRFNPSQIGFEPSAIGRQSQVARLTNPATAAAIQLADLRRNTREMDGRLS